MAYLGWGREEQKRKRVDASEVNSVNEPPQLPKKPNAIPFSSRSGPQKHYVTSAGAQAPPQREGPKKEHTCGLEKNSGGGDCGGDDSDDDFDDSGSEDDPDFESELLRLAQEVAIARSTQKEHLRILSGERGSTKP